MPDPTRKSLSKFSPKRDGIPFARDALDNSRKSEGRMHESNRGSTKDAPANATFRDEAGPANREWTDLHLWQIQPVKDCLWIVITVFLIWVGYELRSIFTPVLIALGLAYLANPLVDAAESRWRVPRPAAISLILGVAILTLVTLAAWLGPLLLDQVTRFAEAAPEYVERIADQRLGRSEEQLGTLADELRARPLNILGTVVSGTSRAFGFVGNMVSATTYFIASTLLIPIYFFMFCWRFHPMLRSLERFAPADQHDRVLDIVRQMDQAVSTFLRARVTIAVVASVFYVLGWSPLLTDVPYWLLLGLLTGALSLIPYAAGAGWLIALLLKFLEMSFNGDTGLTAWIMGLGGPTVVFLLGQVLESWILTPWLQSTSLNLNPITVLIAVLVGGALGGVYGLILAVPVTACGKILWRELALPRLTAWARRSG
jgi:predicted PurR-regulated permease PerM